MKNYPGILIAVEGIDGSGKSTLCTALATALQAFRPVVLTREPGGTALGRAQRQVLSNLPQTTPLAQFLLFAADRAEHIEKIIKPALQRGDIVISDRLADSSYAYQGIAQGVNTEKISLVNNWVMQGIKPNRTIFLSIDSHIAAQRLGARGTDLNTFEKESILQKAAEGFKQLYTNRIDQDVYKVDGTLITQDVINNIIEKLRRDYEF